MVRHLAKKINVLKHIRCHQIVIMFPGCHVCDQICQKGSYTCTVLRHTFHRHLLATSMHQQHMCLLLLKVEQSAFTQAFVSTQSGIHQCSGSLKMAPSSLGKQTASCESPHNWLMSLAMDLAALCDMWR